MRNIIDGIVPTKVKTIYGQKKKQSAKKLSANKLQLHNDIYSGINNPRIRILKIKINDRLSRHCG